MTSKQRNKLIINFALRTTVIFTVGLTVYSIVGFIYSRLAAGGMDVPGMFAYDDAGLPYSYILLFVCLAMALSAASFLFVLLAVRIMKGNSHRYDKLFKRYKINQKR